MFLYGIGNTDVLDVFHMQDNIGVIYLAACMRDAIQYEILDWLSIVLLYIGFFY